jgi:hypothetical protein
MPDGGADDFCDGAALGVRVPETGAASSEESSPVVSGASGVPVCDACDAGAGAAVSGSAGNGVCSSELPMQPAIATIATSAKALRMR